MQQVFLDTSALIALTVKSDSLHASALEVRRSLSSSNAQIVTSRWVLAEFLNALSGSPARPVAASAVDALEHSERTSIIPADDANWRSALDLFRNRADKQWSLTDCSSIVICRDRDIRHVFSHDRHFTQAGLELLL